MIYPVHCYILFMVFKDTSSETKENLYTFLVQGVGQLGSCLGHYPVGGTEISLD